MIAALLASIVVSTNAVTFTAKATGISTNEFLEFVFCGPESDRGYETLFLTDDPLPELRAAFKKAGVPSGKAFDVRRCVFWPTGARVTLEPALKTLVRIRDEKGTGAAKATALLSSPAVLTGGNGLDAEMPQAVFACYSCGQSLLQLDDHLDQSQTYGCFAAARAFAEGEPMTFTVRWDGASFVQDVTPSFPGDKTVAEAVKVARGLAEADSSAFRVNGYREGEFFYRAFLPLEKWRDRRERLVQPLEIRVDTTNVIYTVVDEDWNVEGLDPVLKPRQTSAAEACKPSRRDTCFFYVRPDEKLSRLMEIKATLPENFRNFYVYVDP